jgi:hypothetical protein
MPGHRVEEVRVRDQAQASEQVNPSHREIAEALKTVRDWTHK